MSARLVAFASTARLFAAGAVMVLALRIAIVTWGADGTPPPPDAPRAGPPSSSAGGPPDPLGGGQPRLGPERSTRLSVLVGPDRSKVRVDGVEKGATPFFGDIRCASGATVVIEVEAPGGKAKRFERPCEAPAMKVE